MLDVDGAVERADGGWTAHRPAWVYDPSASRVSKRRASGEAEVMVEYQSAASGA